MINHTIKFGRFRFVPRQRLLTAGNDEVPLGNRALDVLATLVERAGKLVTKEELIACVWPDSIVEAINLRVHIAALRRALGDGQEGSCYISNTVGRGYCFVAPVTIEANEPVQETQSKYRITLPVPLTRMLGRARDLELLIERVKTRRLVNIVGSVGVGKSTLALVAANQLSEHFENGCRYLDLSMMSDSSSDESLQDLAGVLKNQHLLLVLDNCDHMIGVIAALSESLLKQTQRLHILATSREALGAVAEWRYGLQSLDVPDARGRQTAESVAEFSAVKLFVDRAAAFLPTFELNDSNASSVADICRRLDGIPLAIDLSAARINLMNVHDIASHPDACFLDAINARRTAMPRHRTLRAAYDWSIDRLTESEKILLQRLSVFRGSFTLKAAVLLAARTTLDSHDVTDGLMCLTEKSLLRTDIAGYKTRHRLLQTTRAYIVERLALSSDASTINRWHAEAICGTLHDAETARATMPFARWLDEYGYIIDDARAAMMWAFSDEGDATMGEEISAALQPLTRATVPTGAIGCISVF